MAKTSAASSEASTSRALRTDDEDPGGHHARAALREPAARVATWLIESVTCSEPAPDDDVSAMQAFQNRLETFFVELFILHHNDPPITLTFDDAILPGLHSIAQQSGLRRVCWPKSSTLRYSYCADMVYIVVRNHPSEAQELLFRRDIRAA